MSSHPTIDSLLCIGQAALTTVQGVNDKNASEVGLGLATFVRCPPVTGGDTKDNNQGNEKGQPDLQLGKPVGQAGQTDLHGGGNVA